MDGVQSEKEEPTEVNTGQISSEFVAKGNRGKVGTKGKDMQRKEKEHEVAAKVAKEKEERAAKLNEADSRISAASASLAQKCTSKESSCIPFCP